jgi:adenosylcobyric acid synthase
MALNASVTPDGLEIGRAQAVQAEAAGIAPTADMNPILLKPEGDARSQVVVLGRPIGSLGVAEYQAKNQELRALVRGALDRLRAAHDVVVIEGAGSPAEINLKERDLVNMFVAGAAGCKVVLVGDIDRGGVFAAFVGTLELLDASERARVGALLVNKFRGDISLLEPGLRFVEQRTGVPVLGVLPYVRQLRIADEDSVSLDDRRVRRRAGRDEVEVAIVRFPRISNHDDFQPLEHLPGVAVRFVEHAEELAGADLVVLPGSKSTVADLQWLRETRLEDPLRERARKGQPVLGICGGCQMLGMTIEDPDGVESRESRVSGLGLLPIRTRFSREKRTTQVRARPLAPSLLASEGAPEVSGYEIHMGRLERDTGARGAFALIDRNGRPTEDIDGAVSSTAPIMGTMLHGLFENVALREELVAQLRARRGLAPALRTESSAKQPDEYDRLAGILRDHIDTGLLERLLVDDPSLPDEGLVLR